MCHARTVTWRTVTDPEFDSYSHTPTCGKEEPESGPGRVSTTNRFQTVNSLTSLRTRLSSSRRQEHTVENYTFFLATRTGFHPPTYT